MRGYLGVDVGSVSTNVAIINDKKELISKLYIRTGGQPVKAVKEAINNTKDSVPKNLVIKGACTTGSARYLSQAMIGADLTKTEITAHAVASSFIRPEVKTIVEIGGQDSKIIIMRNGVVIDFAMNTVCAAGTGSFLDHQASRLDLKIEDFGNMALRSKADVNIAGRCTVFAESDMIHKQQLGHNIPDIINGLCTALVRNYLNNIAKSKTIEPPIMFQGGVAANKGIRKALERALGYKIIVPKDYDVMGAIGAALLAQEHSKNNGGITSFRGFDLADFDYKTRSFDCKHCPNCCEIINVMMNKKLIARWGSRCGRWNTI